MEQEIICQEVAIPIWAIVPRGLGHIQLDILALGLKSQGKSISHVCTPHVLVILTWLYSSFQKTYKIVSVLNTLFEVFVSSVAFLIHKGRKTHSHHKQDERSQCSCLCKGRKLGFIGYKDDKKRSQQNDDKNKGEYKYYSILFPGFSAIAVKSQEEYKQERREKEANDHQ